MTKKKKQGNLKDELKGNLKKLKTPKNLSEESKKDNNSKPKNKKSLKDRNILRVMIEAQKELNVAEIAKKSRESEASIFVWLCSVGKITPNIKKISKDIYIYEDPDQKID